MQSRFLEDFEIIAISRELTREEWLPLFVSLKTGLRVGDVVKIRVRDLRDNGVRYVAEKTGKVGFAELPRDTLQQLREQARHGWCFPSPFNKKTHLTRQAVWYRIKRAALRAGVSVEGVSPHALRKSFAVFMFGEKGLRATMDALQHDHANTTALYAHADWLTGENAKRPLCRGDLPVIASKIAELIFEAHKG
ncbi:MAG: tyrosine-type recombinase/integrase [Rikenellaceae bacterium]|nr:tyrosine-type recombinase/integrase [Rikenellaceae bacterium]